MSTRPRPFVSTPPRGQGIRVRTPPVGDRLRIGVMGGSFDPPHEGHLTVAETALRRLRLDRLWWLVSPGNPLKDHAQLAPLCDRMAEARALAADTRMAITAFERDLDTAYTAKVLDFLTGRYPRAHFVWIMGADNLASFHRWQQWRTIAQTVPIAVVDRPGYRLKALASPAGRAFADYRLPEALAPRLAITAPPAMVMLTTRLSPLSSTSLRASRSTLLLAGHDPQARIVKPGQHDCV
ncbi:MAG: nicotinate-nucleotide adenylyltransferase [Hyphomicrobiaceae bacterium]|nr:nicotinate-nucleotide adenylyltransferase [Hyphomicrobiaceae bacterium]